MSSPNPPVWVLLGQRTGDNNQLLRLAGELGVGFRAIDLGYNPLHFFPPRLLGATFASLSRESRDALQPPWPDLILGIGHRSVPAALEIRKQSGDRSKLVRLGNPRLDPRHFDLVVTTPQYDVPSAPNVLRLPIGLSTASGVEPTREESAWLAKLPRPHRLLLIGGDTFMWALAPRKVAAAAKAITEKSDGSTIAVSSARSNPQILEIVADALGGSEHAVIRGGFPRYAVLLADADEIYVTADSVAMISDAIATGKPVALIEPEPTAAGRFFYAGERYGAPVPVRNIRRFWVSIRQAGLVGTVDQPRAGQLKTDALAETVGAVKRLLDS